MGHKKTFSCGHKGHGQYCHRCRQEEERRAAEARSKMEWTQRLEAAPVRLDHVPRPVSEKTLAALEQLAEGVPYAAVKGKRLIGHRDVVAIPGGYSCRLVLEDREEGLVPAELLSREAYNQRMSGGAGRRV